MPGVNPADPGGSPITLNPDGTINYGSLPGGSNGGQNKSIPINPNTGSLDFWSYILPPELTGIDPATHKPPTINLGITQWATRQVTQMRGRGGDMTKVNVKQPYSFNPQMSASEVMDFFQKLAYSGDPKEQNEFLTLTRLLADGAFYGTGESSPKNFGGFDQATQTALASAMVQYLQATGGGAYKSSFLDFLGMRAAQVTAANGGKPLSGGPGGGGGGGGMLPSRPALMDPDTLKMYAQKAAQNALGRNLNPDELSNFVDQFHNEQVSAFDSALNNNGAAVDKNDPRASAIRFVTSGHEGEFKQHQIQGYMDALLNEFLPAGSNMPNMNVDPTLGL